MESNNNDNYVLVLEDRTEVKNEKYKTKILPMQSQYFLLLTQA